MADFNSHPAKIWPGNLQRCLRMAAVSIALSVSGPKGGVCHSPIQPLYMLVQENSCNYLTFTKGNSWW